MLFKQAIWSMQGKFVKNLSLLLVLNLMIKPFWVLGIDRTVHNTLGAEEYGFYFAVFNFSFLFNILLDAGLTNFNNKTIAQNRQLLTKHLSNIFVLKLILFFVYLLLTFVTAFFIQYSQEQMRLLYLLAFNQFLLSFLLYLRSNLGGLHLFRTDSLISVLDRVLMIAICSVLIWGNVVGEFRIQYYVYAQTAGYLITVVVAGVLVLRHSQRRFLRLNWNFPFLVSIVRQSFPFAVLVLLMTFYNRVDSVMLERMLDNGALYSGIYASAYRLLDAANMIAYLFAVLLLPIFARMIKQHLAVENLARLSFTLLITPAIVFAVSAVFYAGDLMEMLYPIHPEETQAAFYHRIEQSAPVFGVLMICFLAIASTYVFGTLLTARGSLWKLNVTALVGVALNIFLNILLIPRFQAVGSAVASLFTQVMVALVQIYIVKNLFGFRVNYGFLGRMVFFIVGTILINMGSLLFPFPWKVSLLLAVLFSISLAVVSGMLSPRHIYQLMRYGEA